MLNNYDHKFEDDGGRLIFVPTKASRKFGDKLIERILKRWQPPAFYYHLQPGGHIAAAKAHLANNLFVRMDIQRFYDTVTRTKVHRSLRGIGFKQRHAFDAAQHSTVSKAASGHGAPFSLPFGFVQSPMLATLALTSSSLGTAIWSIHSAGRITVSVYMDDILMSGACAADLEVAKAAIEAAAAMAEFVFNPKKASGPGPLITVFNLNIAQANMKLTPKRFAAFEANILTDLVGHVTGGILSYVSTVNAAQHSALADLKP